ncbi:MAG: hypothetical protein WC412_06120 [Candidatus Omnitrophota bacterium]|jgi:type II secretory pathway component PulC
MPIKNILIFFIFLNALGSYSFAQNKTDPFDSLLPVKEEQRRVEELVKTPQPPEVSIEGALWDSDMPQAIIDGDVYKVGDTLKSINAKIYKIEKNRVFIFYEGILYEMKVTGKK